MDYSRLTVFTINIDGFIFAFLACLSALILITVFLQEQYLAKRILELIQVKTKLRSLATQGKTVMRRVCPVIIEKTSPGDFLELTRSTSSFMPPEFAEDLRACFATSGRIDDLEKNATSRWVPKWQKIEMLVSLGYAQDSEATSILTTALRNNDADISYYAMLSLAQLKTKEAAKALLGHLGKKRSDNRKIASCLENFSPDIIDELAHASASGNDSVRFWSLRILSKFKDQKSFPWVIRLAKDPSPEVRASCCECLGELGDPAAQPALLERLNDPVWFVRLHAVRSLHKLLGQESLDFVGPLKIDSHWLVRDAVKKILSQHKNPKES